MVATPKAQRTGRVAIVLHAHLPYVRSRSGDEDVEERWLYEALWECYLPLLALLRRHAQAAKAPKITLSLSPTLLSMLEDPHYRQGFGDYARTLGEMAKRAAEVSRLAGGIADHQRRLDAGRALYAELRGKLVGAFADLAKANALELITSAATHAYLPNLLTPASIRAQLRLGGRYLHQLTGLTTRGLWLPECGISPLVARELAASGASFTVLDEHGLQLASAAPSDVFAPLLSPDGVAYFGRHTELVARVWSRERGYPGDSVYREFHRDLVDDDSTRAVVACPWFGASGLRPYRVTGASAKQPYSPLAARKRAREHAEDWVAQIDEALAAVGRPDGTCVLAFDAELFGHWFWEGPDFLDAVLTLLGDRAVSLGDVLDEDPELAIAEPAQSSWGDGGFSEVWTHPEVTHLVRSAHRAERRVTHVDELVRDTPKSPVQRRARLASIRQLLLLQASDFAFMRRGGESEPFVTRRTREHAVHVERLTAIAKAPSTSQEDELYVRRVEARWPVFAELDEDALADVFDAFE